MGFATFQAHKAHAAKFQPRATTPDAACTSGGFYISPTNGATINSLDPLLIKWDTTCIDSQTLDIHLLAPWYGGPNTEITVWPGVTNADGQKSVNISPKWWNSTAQVKVQLTIVAAGLPAAMATLPAGPIFTATYNGSAAGSAPAGDAATAAMPTSGTSKSLSGGQTAAAVIVPLLIVGLAIFAYLRYQRRIAANKSKRFSQALDQRMSTISADWKSTSVAGAQAAVRASIALSRDAPPQAMKQVRTGTGVGLRNPGAAAAIAAERASRVSRVSFADTAARPSTDSRRARAGLPGAYVPPVPSRKDVVSGAPSVYPDSDIEKRLSGAGVHAMSPRQTSGPLTLTPDDIQARMHGRASPAPEKNEEYEQVMPALSLMRLSSTDDYLLPQPPPPTHAPAAPPVISPDDMLRAYAVRQSSSSAASPPLPPPQSKTKGRKLSIRAGLGMIRKERVRSPMEIGISYPVPSTLVHQGSAPVGAGADAGMAGVGARYAVGYEDAYGGVRTMD